MACSSLSTPLAAAVVISPTEWPAAASATAASPAGVGLSAESASSPEATRSGWATAVSLMVSALADVHGGTRNAAFAAACADVIAAGADVKVVQRMLGHADASMTLNTYADLWPDRLDEVVEAISLHRERALSNGHHD